MKRWLFALLLALGASAIWVGAAFADASTYHSAYTNTTRACAGCHRAHTGSGQMLIKASSTYGLCTSCHGSTSGVDVVDGVEWQTDPTTHAALTSLPPVGALKGGGFVQAMMNTSLAATGPTAPGNAIIPAVAATTTTPAVPAQVVPNSAHRVNGMPIYTQYAQGTTPPAPTTYSGPATIWGIGLPSSTANPGTSFTLECSTCHDPHGKSGTDSTGAAVPTYRLLRSNIGAKVTGAAGPVTVPEDTITSHDYAVDSTTLVYYGQSYSATGTTGTSVDQTKISQWCATCHTRIHASGSAIAGTNPGSHSSTDAIYNFRHVTDGSSADNNFGPTGPKDAGGHPSCLTCHVSHGSSALMTRQAAQVPVPSAAGEAGTTYLDSSLLRVDNRGVCELCHNK